LDDNVYDDDPDFAGTPFESPQKSRTVKLKSVKG